MSFVQIIDMRTKNVDEIQNLEREWEKATEGKRTLRRSIIGRDRNDPDHYLVLAFFDSYESAMTNSNLPETTEFGRKQSYRRDRLWCVGIATNPTTERVKIRSATLAELAELGQGCAQCRDVREIHAYVNLSAEGRTRRRDGDLKLRPICLQEHAFAEFT